MSIYIFTKVLMHVYPYICRIRQLIYVGTHAIIISSARETQRMESHKKGDKENEADHKDKKSGGNNGKPAPQAGIYTFKSV